MSWENIHLHAASNGRQFAVACLFTMSYAKTLSDKQQNITTKYVLFHDRLQNFKEIRTDMRCVFIDLWIFFEVNTFA